MTNLVILVLFAAVVAMFVVVRQVKSSALEWSLLCLSAVAQLVLLFMGWGDLENVHGGAVLLVLVMLIGLAVFLGELFLTLRNPSRGRFLQLTGVVAYSALLLVVGDKYGG